MIDQPSKEELKELDNEIGKVLISLASFRTKSVDNEEELEDAGEIFLDLNTQLLLPQGKELFESHKGLELLMILYRKQKNFRSFIVKTLDFALSQKLSL